MIDVLVPIDRTMFKIVNHSLNPKFFVLLGSGVVAEGDGDKIVKITKTKNTGQRNYVHGMNRAASHE